MSFGFGGSSGFGQNNNNQQQQSTGFGFGANTNTNTGFGSTTNTGFGSTNNNTTGGGLFGSGSSGFGSNNSGGFGTTNTNTGFGAKPSGFGSTATTSGGGLFGGNNTATAGTSGFGGGFGSTAPTTLSTGFGASNTGGSLFGGNKTGFGSTAAPSSNPFGGTATTTPFGGSNTTVSGFGAPTSTALGGATGECQGTGSVPFAPFVEKEPNSSTNQQNSFQSISFQQPYQKWSPEELRLADYTQGRRYGNQSNQAGAFGANTNFGGFGSNTQTTNTGFGANTGTSTNLFGSGTNTGFGTSQSQSTGFGSNTATSGSMFGAKPATGGLFGNQTQTQSSGGLFGSGGSTGFGTNTTGGFGNQNSSTAPSLFGNNTAASKPTFSFGTAAPASTATTFGSTPAPTGFGGGSLFGNTQQNTATTGFGVQQQQQQQPAGSNVFGSFGSNTQQPAGSSLFGANQQKPATTGLFGQQTATTGGGLFGATQPAANNNPFGTSTNTQQTGSLFGAKPATTGTGLFGAPQNAQTNTGGSSLFSGFGNQTQNQPQQQQGTTLFGSLNTNTQPKPSLFGAQPQQSTGTSLFGNSGTQQGGGLFSSTSNNQQQQSQQGSSLFGGGGNSLFGGSQQNQQQQTPQNFTASVTDITPYGNGSLFGSLNQNQTNNPGPLATPLSSAKQKKPAALPLYKLNPTSSSRFSTPAKRGFGFSYSNYGSPNSVSSAASTPGGNLNGSLLGGSLGRGLTKSMSASSLRRTFNNEDSILSPGAFSASPGTRHYGSTGSIKKLVINRGLRGDLFSPPSQESQQPPNTPNGSILKKRVSFDASTIAGNGASSPLKPVSANERVAPSSEDLGYLRPRPSANGTKPNGTATPPEMQQVNNTELAIVHEEEVSAPAPPKPAFKPLSTDDQEPGEYWMNPSKAEIEAMRPEQRKIANFTAGRYGVGQVRFNTEAENGVVDLSKVNLDEIFDKLVDFKIRSCTVYPEAAKKPAVGNGLNVPSTISLENSWPRGKDKQKAGLRLKKHIDRLQKVQGTTFVDYNQDTGVWTFTVPHFTTYKLDLDDDETDGEGTSEFGQSTLSAPPDTPTPQARTPKSQNYDESFASTSQLTRSESDPEDTFDFRKKKARPLPGAFDDQDVDEEDDGMEDGEYEQDEQSFLDKRSVGSQSEEGVEESMNQDDVFYDNGSVSVVDHEMAGSFPQADNTAEQDDDSHSDDGMDMVEDTPGGAMRARLRALKNSGTPLKRKFTAGNDWTSTLKTTISPQKQDRALLKSLIDINGNDTRPIGESTPAPRNRIVSDGRGFATSIDLMNSLFGQARSPTKVAKIPAQSKGFEWPYTKKPKTSDNDNSNMTDFDLAFHDSLKPNWGPDGTLVYAVSSNARPFGKSSRRARERNGLLTIQKGGVISQSRDVRFARFSNEASAEALKKHMALVEIDDSGDIPFAKLPEQFSFSQFFDDRNAHNPAASHEKLVWQLASVLFDEIPVQENLQKVPNAVHRLRKDSLSAFWKRLVDPASSQHVAMARSNEEKAIAALSGHRVSDACGHLLDGKNYHLATLVALIGSKESVRKDIREQLNEWQKQKVLSEFSQPIRAIYELLSGNVCVCDGSKPGPIEDQIKSFVISKRFGLDWRQAFGLRLWYGSLAGDDISVPIETFLLDLEQEKETSLPHSWYVEQKVPTLWEDKDLEKREDLLWGLLKLYTFPHADLEAILRPENSQLSPLDIRLSWQLSRALTAAGMTYGEDAEDKADQVTLSFASQLTNEGSWLDAVFVLLHLTSDSARGKSIQDHLAHHAGRIGAEDSHSFTTLAQAFKIPKHWIWEAKALYMRSVKKDPKGEVGCLIKAGSFDEAHRTFAKDVAPKTVIECDYDTLRLILSGFRGKENSVTKWHLGGEIYQDFLELLDCQKKATAVDYAVLDRLLNGLPAVVEQSRHPGFMETIAIETISSVVAKIVVNMGKKGEKSDLSKVLRLPLTEDKYLKHTVDLSVGYYRDVMAGGRL